MKTKLLLLGLLLLLFLPSTAKAQSATLTWTAPTVPTPAALTYKVERANTQNGTYTQVGTPAATTLVDTNVTRGSTYWYRVYSSCPATGAGCGTTTNPIRGDSATALGPLSGTIPNAPIDPPPPTSLTITTQ